MEGILRDFIAEGIALPMFASLLTGILIGAEREWYGKPAGLRTHALVCLASCLLTLAAARQVEWTMHLVEGTQIVSDPTRMAHGVLTGIGFLGAGVIFREGATVQGLTTAASLWITAALGVVYGVGAYWIALSGTVATLLVLVVLRILNMLLPGSQEVRLHVVAAPGFGPAQLREILRAEGMERRPVSKSRNATTGLAELTSTTRSRSAAQFDALCAALERAPGVIGYAALSAEDAAGQNPGWHRIVTTATDKGDRASA
ncbi:MgtC/SapB family protein [Rhizobiaceae bacterium BDR2-2]|uniref:Protein MgtC n=1 Tax=Ectorhizobium quercum TaxID=2965071 RepID=A0AAE3MYJ6_9HYPH|nr:MgtC/SapB family protein [Ectorhizobium quercum]MCX8997393.1 MgtC/SapB family protein [Ectorhizobium quercum]